MANCDGRSHPGPCTAYVPDEPKDEAVEAAWCQHAKLLGELLDVTARRNFLAGYNARVDAAVVEERKRIAKELGNVLGVGPHGLYNALWEFTKALEGQDAK